HIGELPFDRTMKVSLTGREEILQRILHNLRTVASLLEHDAQDFLRIIDSHTPEDERQRLRRARRISNRKAARLVEELPIRTPRVEPLMHKLEEVSNHMDKLEKKIANLNGLDNTKDDQRALETELQELMLLVL